MDLNEGLDDFTGDGSGGGVEEYERLECERDGEGERKASQTGEGGEGE